MMKTFWSWGLLSAALFLGAVPLPAIAAEPAPSPAYLPDAGSTGFAELELQWWDQARQRELPVRIYYPKDGAGPFPVIIFSHGLGGSRDHYRYLGEAWARHGYVSVHLQHRGSDDSVWKGKLLKLRALRRAAKEPANALNRPLDVRFAIDQLEKLNQAPGVLQGRLDLSRLGVAGHSFGGFTTLAVAGEVFVNPEGKELSAPDPRVKAVIAMSAPVTKRTRETLDQSFAKIRIPCLHLTGTLDDSPIGETTAADRRLPYDHIVHSEQVLITFQGGDHMIFSGRPWKGKRSASDPRFQDLIRQSTTAFWDATLKDSAPAKAWLIGDGFRTTLGADGVLEHKTAAAGP